MAFDDLFLILAIHTHISSHCWGSSHEEQGAVPRSPCAFAYAIPSWLEDPPCIPKPEITAFRKSSLTGPTSHHSPPSCLAPFYLVSPQSTKLFYHVPLPFSWTSLRVPWRQTLCLYYLYPQGPIVLTHNMFHASLFNKFVKEYKCLLKRLWMDTWMGHLRYLWR